MIATLDAPTQAPATAPRNTILQGDALTVLRRLPSRSVQCVVTSPPYWGLRDYGTARWEGGNDSSCDHKGPPARTAAGFNARYFGHEFDSDKQGEKREVYRTLCARCGASRLDAAIGLEPSLDAYLAALVAVFREVRRVLRSDGTLWLNLGDLYCANSVRRENGNRDQPIAGGGDLPQWSDYAANGHAKYAARMGSGLKPKDLVGLPWRVAFALQADGWWLRSDIVWAKPNPMPESVTDRPTKSHEMLFLLAKQASYYYDAETIREPHAEPWRGHGEGERNNWSVNGQRGSHETAREYNPAGRNKRSVWTVATHPFPEAHFATFPPALVTPCILAGSSPMACEHCGAPWERKTEATGELVKVRNGRGPNRKQNEIKHFGTTSSFKTGYMQARDTTGWRPTCRCKGNTGAGRSLVLDPFMGAGTVGLVAKQAARDYLGIEMNPAYIEMAERRIASNGRMGKRQDMPEGQRTLWEVTP